MTSKAQLDHEIAEVIKGNERKPRFAIGTRYKTRDKHPRECTVVDIHKTFNMAGELVKIRYVATHNFAGQVLTDNDVVETTIARGLL